MSGIGNNSVKREQLGVLNQPETESHSLYGPNLDRWQVARTCF